jgi:RHS repeat-associated protein
MLTGSWRILQGWFRLCVWLALATVVVVLLSGGLGGSRAVASVPSTAIRYAYNPDGRLSAVINPASETALYSWDSAGNLLTVTRKSSTKLSIIQLEPATGAVGETIDIWGTGFSTTPSDDTVKFNGTAATVTAATTYTLAVKVPSGASSGTVTVQTTTEGPVTSSQSFTVAASPAPTITSISSSVAAAGTVITMTGTNFETHAYDDAVRVNQTLAELTSESSTSIKFMVPEATGSGRVTISTPQGSAIGPYLYIPPPGYTTGKIGPTVNLSFGSASVLSITSAKTVGLATIEVKAGESLSAVLAKSTITSGFVRVYTPSNVEIGAATSFEHGKEALLSAVTLPVNGTYTILVSPESEYTGSVELTPYSVVNVTGPLSPSTGGTAETVSLPTPGQKAKYAVSGTAGEEVSLKVSEFSFSGLVVLEWLNPAGKEIAEKVFSGGGFMDSVTFPTTGTYTLVVNPYLLSTGSLKLTAYNATAVTGSISPTSGGESKTLTMSVPGQNAKITFSGTSGQEVSLLLSESTIKSQAVAIYNPEGKLVTEKGAITSTEMVGPVTLSSTGTYTILVNPEGENTGSVKLSAYSVVDVTGSLSPSTGGTSETVSLPAPGQKAKYSVSATAGEEVSLKLSEFSFTGLVVLEWLNPEGKEIAEGDFSSNGFLDTVKFPTTATYTLAVNPYKVSTGSMKLTAYNAAAVTGSITPTSGGESKTLTTSVPGQNAKITFAGTSGQEVSLVLSEVTIKSGVVSIENPEGKALSERSFSSSSKETTLGPVKLSSNGTYTIFINPESEYTGSLKLSAYLGSPPKGMVLRRASAGEAATATIGGIAPTQGAFGATTPIAPAPASSVRSSTPALLLTDAKGSSVAQSTSARPSELHVTTKARDLLSPAVRSFHPAGSGAWYPPARNRGGLAWRTELPASPWAKLAPVSAGPGATSLAGQALKLNGLPLAGLHVAIENTDLGTRTDAEGQFLLQGAPAGHQVLAVEGATIDGLRYGTFEIGVQITAHQQTTLDAPIWMTPLDSAGEHWIGSPTRGPVTITTPRIPGLEVRIPAGTVIRDASGRVVHNLNITAVPVDRPPFPLPFFVDVPLYFTVQPGRAYLSKGAQIVYPNYTHLPAGQRVSFWNYDPDGRGWYIYGQGTVTPNGKQVIPDPGVRVWEFTGSMITGSPKPPKTGTLPGTASNGGDPVDLSTGLFNYHKTDLVLPDTIPIVIERSYRQGDSNSYSFGVGTSSLYDMRLWSENNYHEADLVLPDGGTVLYKRVSSGEGFEEAEYKATGTPSMFYDSTIKWNGSVPGWDLTLTNGTTYVFGELAPLQAIRNRQGQQLTITREKGQTGNITQITSPHGRWVKFAYNGSNDITEIKDNGGRTLKYAYNKEGLLESATDPAERTTKYGYDTAGDMTSITDARGNKYVEVEYNANDRVAKQTDGDKGTFEFSYALGGSGKVESATVTEPRGNKRKVTFNSEGFSTSETAALGGSVEQTTTFERQAGTGFVLSMTDARSRKTAYEYDSYGNVTSVTQLAGTASAQTTKYAYEPQTSELAKETDPLSHSTTYEYNSLGELVARTDALGHTTHIEYNSDGQPSVITNPLGKKTTLAYEAGELTSVTDPLGRTSRQFLDTLGRVASQTTPSGLRTLYGYDPDNELTSITSPSSAQSTIEYDADGDITAVTDPRKDKTTATYDVMDRLESETDPLGKTMRWAYDTAGFPTEITDRRGLLTTLEYDPLGRLTSASFGVSGKTAQSSITYGYDSGNRLTSIEDTAGGNYKLGYDELNRLTEFNGPNGTVGYEYDAANRRTKMTAPGQEPVKYTYDEANRLTELVRGTQTVGLGYNAANQPTSVKLIDGIEELYGYDEAGETTSIEYKKGSEVLGELDYAYNLNGLTEAMWGSYARTNLPETMSTASVYNADNEMTERGGKTLTYNADGELTSDGSNEYTWDDRGQLSSISGATTASFTYDPFSRRTSKTLSGTTTKQLYDGPNVIQESVSGTVTANMLTGLQPDQIFSRTTSTSTENLLTNLQRSTIGLGESAGKVKTTYTYDPFGTTTTEGATSTNPFQYTGRENDGDGLQYNRARYYNPANGRFVSQDPASFTGSGPDLYQYAGGDPLDHTDPLGLCNWNPLSGSFWSEGNCLSEHPTQALGGAAAAACVIATAGGCGGAVAIAFGASTYYNYRSAQCGSFWGKEAASAGWALVAAGPSLIFGGLQFEGLITDEVLPSTTVGRMALNGYLTGPAIGVIAAELGAEANGGAAGGSSGMGGSGAGTGGAGEGASPSPGGSAAVASGNGGGCG